MRGRGCCGPGEGPCCRIESLVSVDERGQMVLPKEVREKAGIRAGDKLAVVSWGRDGGIACITLIKAEELAGRVRDMLGPMLQDIQEKGE
ncbi:MAG: AbrB/MazE/SpoVT family DNA-binding domain-containing protein [Chloroflexi bacterium]|nr:AbrB/MazE/SpoVT family DNA-binding domain-containing protein [Chloroflexota bacterium]